MLISNLLQFGYLGFLVCLTFICYRIITDSKNNSRTFVQTVIIILLFMVFSVIAGGAGYVWSSKELEVSKSNESIMLLIKEQIKIIDDSHDQSMKPLVSAQENITKLLNYTSLSSLRKNYVHEIMEINEMIKSREVIYVDKLKALRTTIDSFEK